MAAAQTGLARAALLLRLCHVMYSSDGFLYQLGFIVLFLLFLLKWLWFFHHMWYFISIMSENPLTPTTPDENFQDIFDMQAADASRRMLLGEKASYDHQAVEEQNKNEVKALEDKHEREHKLGTKVMGGVAAVAFAAGAVSLAVEAGSTTPERSEETTTITVMPGDGLQAIAEQVPGSNKYDVRDTTDSIAGDPANIDVLKDGLQPGESITVPIEFK